MSTRPLFPTMSFSLNAGCQTQGVKKSTTRSFLTLTEFLECAAGCREKISVCISFSFCFCYLDIGIGQPRWCSKCLETGNPRLGSSDGGWLLHYFLRFCATFVARNNAWPLGCVAFSEWLLGHETRAQESFGSSHGKAGFHGPET